MYRPSKRGTIRLAVYGAMEVCALFVNFGLNSFLHYLEVTLWTAVVIGYILGGQTKFWLHNSVTWRDHHPTFEGIGKRWRAFTFGNFVGLTIYTIAFVTYVSHGVEYARAFVLAVCTSWLWNTSWVWLVVFGSRKWKTSRIWLRLFGSRRPLEPPTTEEERSC